MLNFTCTLFRPFDRPEELDSEMNRFPPTPNKYPNGDLMTGAHVTNLKDVREIEKPILNMKVQDTIIMNVGY